MEKFFVHILDVIKYLEVKAQEKSQRKKYWVLGNQYLQPVDEVEEEKKCLNYDLKKKLQCLYQAARCGMKEGVLTGVFFGGFYGIVKILNENVGNALMPSSLSKVNSSREGKDQNPAEKNITVNESENKNAVQSGNNNNQLQSDSFREQTFARDNALKNKKRGKSTFIKSEVPDRDSINELKSEKRPKSARKSVNENSFSFENVRPYTVTNVENNKFKSREEVDIVGYAFVQTLETKDSESSDNTASDDSDKRKEDSQKTEDKNESQNMTETKERGNSDQSGRSSVSTYPSGVVSSVRDVHKKKKLVQKNGDHSKVEQTKANSSSSSSHESYPAQVLVETKSKPTNEMKPTNENKSESENQKDVRSSHQSTTVQSKQKPVSDKGKISSSKGFKKGVLKGSRVSVKGKESKESKADIKRAEKTKKAKNCFSKSEKGSSFSKQKKSSSDASKIKPFNPFYENFFIPSRISKSILVDADVISNGYSLSLNNESLNSDEGISHLTESNFNILDASGHRIGHLIERSRATIKDDDSISYAQPKKLAFVEPEFIPVSEEPSTHFESSTPSLAQINESSGNNKSVDSFSSSIESGQASHSSIAETLNKPVSVQRIESVNRNLGGNQPDSSHSVKPSSKSNVVDSIGSTVLSKSTSPKAVSIGDSAETSFVENYGSSVKQSKELRTDKHSEAVIVGSELTTNKVTSVKESAFTDTPKSGYLLIKNVSDNLILLSACNCAVVLGVLCAVISTTKASLSF